MDVCAGYKIPFKLFKNNSYPLKVQLVINLYQKLIINIIFVFINYFKKKFILKTIRHDIQLLYTWIEGTVNYYTLQLNIGITSMNKN